MQKLIQYILMMSILLTQPVAAAAETWEFAVWKESGNAIHDQGDVITYKPHPWTWGALERRNFAIVVIDGLTEDEARNLCQPYYKDDKQWIDHDDDPDTPDIENEIIKDRKYQLKFDSIKSLSSIKEADFSAFGGGTYVKHADGTATLSGENQPLKKLTAINFKETAWITDKYQKKDVTVGTAAVSAGVVR